MKNLIIILSLSIVFTFISCDDEAHIQVENKVHNVQLENISFGGIAMYDKLLPGETSKLYQISEEYSGVSLPLTEQLQFYMVKAGNKVYLKTKETYTLKKDKTLKITISDDTEVVNILTGETKSIKE